MRAREVELDTEPFRRKLAAARAAVEKTREELGIDRHHDSEADSGALSEDEERRRADRSR